MQTKQIMIEKFGATVVYGDTDSVMVTFPLDPNIGEEMLLKESFRLGEEAAEYVTNVLGDCNELECEKASLPFLLFGKKTYVARVFETPTGPPKLDMKGIAVVRRDTCDFAAKAMKSILHFLIMERSVNKAVEVLNTLLNDIIENKIPIEDYVLSKRLSGSYASQNLPHLAVIKKMEERNPGSAPQEW